jgi:hypothetical protein
MQSFRNQKYNMSSKIPYSQQQHVEKYADFQKPGGQHFHQCATLRAAACFESEFEFIYIAFEYKRSEKLDILFCWYK